MCEPYRLAGPPPKPSSPRIRKDSIILPRCPLSFRQFLSLLLAWGWATFAIAQADSLRIDFVPTWDGDAAQLGHAYVTSAGDTITLTQLRFIVGAYGDAGAASPDQWHLFDLAAPTPFIVSEPVLSPAKTLQLLLGVDSLTNTRGAQGGALDPTNGMYWAWQSGYINVKLEGMSTRCGGDFALHLGGFLGGDLAAQLLALPLAKDQGELTVHIDVGAFLARAFLDGPCRIMRPSEVAVATSELFANSIKAQP